MNERENLDYKSLLLLDEISKNNAVTQRDLSRNLGVALGLINSYMKNLVSKGYITISAIPKKRYAYYLTPKGFSEKTRLTCEHLRNFTNLYRFARRDFLALFQSIKALERDLSLVFCGTDEVAEIAYLSLKEAELELRAILDDKTCGGKFFGLTVMPLEEATRFAPDLIIITSFQRGRELKKTLLSIGVPVEVVLDISGGDWLKKIEGNQTGSAK
jgi:DNA-binding MarR family transcriptional regulator